jgi:hypothetical protein
MWGKLFEKTYKDDPMRNPEQPTAFSLWQGSSTETLTQLRAIPNTLDRVLILAHEYASM